MAFTFTNYAGLPITKSPLAQDFLGNALKQYQEMIKSKYAPQMAQSEIMNKMAEAQYNAERARQAPELLQSEIFARRLGALSPLAQPGLLTQYPELEESVRRMVSQRGGQASQGIENLNGTARGYGVRAKEDYQDLLKLGKSLTKAGGLNLYASQKAATAEASGHPFFAGLIKDFTGITPSLSNEQIDFTTKLNALKHNLVQAGRISHAQAEKDFVIQPHETYEHAAKRLGELYPELFLGKKPEAEKKSSVKPVFQKQISKTAKNRGISENDVIDALAKKMGISIDRFMNEVYQGE